MESPELYWSRLAAIGQIAGALATFAAAAVALWLGRSERDFKLRAQARFASIVDVNGSTDVMTIEVHNTGFRKVIVTGFGWTTGFVSRFGLVPKPLRIRSIYQMPDYSWPINENFPWSIEPNETKMTHMRREEFIGGMIEEHPMGLFRTLWPFKQPFLLNHRVIISISTRDYVYFGAVGRSLTETLTTRYRERIELA